MTISRDQATAYAEFLLSEKIRHQEDIKAIDEKLAALARKGIVPAQVGPWIKTEDIEAVRQQAAYLADQIKR